MKKIKLNGEQWAEIYQLPYFQRHEEEWGKIVARGCYCDSGCLVETWTIRVCRAMDCAWDDRVDTWELINDRGLCPSEAEMTSLAWEAQIMTEAYQEELKAAIAGYIGLEYDKNLAIERVKSEIFCLVRIEEIKEI